ncbi:MAG: hypothetical protein WC381_10690 [Kiritimatiellia bacterium]|jgi:hypothetical protein
MSPKIELPEPEPEVLEGSPDDILNEAAVAYLLGCKPRRVRDLMREGALLGRLTGHGGWRTTRRAVAQYLENMAQEAKHE